MIGVSLQAVVNVLESCGHDIDEAIRQLGQLNLTQAQASALASGRSSDKDAKVSAEAANSKHIDILVTTLCIAV